MLAVLALWVVGIVYGLSCRLAPLTGRLLDAIEFRRFHDPTARSLDGMVVDAAMMNWRERAIWIRVVGKLAATLAATHGPPLPGTTILIVASLDQPYPLYGTIRKGVGATPGHRVCLLATRTGNEPIGADRVATTLVHLWPGLCGDSGSWSAAVRLDGGAAIVLPLRNEDWYRFPPATTRGRRAVLPQSTPASGLELPRADVEPFDPLAIPHGSTTSDTLDDLGDMRAALFPEG